MLLFRFYPVNTHDDNITFQIDNSLRFFLHNCNIRYFHFVKFHMLDILFSINVCSIVVCELTLSIVFMANIKIQVKTSMHSICTYFYF